MRTHGGLWSKRDFGVAPVRSTWTPRTTADRVAELVRAESARRRERVAAQRRAFDIDGTTPHPTLDFQRNTPVGYEVLARLAAVLRAVDERRFAESGGEYGFVPWHRELLDMLTFVFLRVIFGADFDDAKPALLARAGNRAQHVRSAFVVAGRRSGKTKTTLLFLAALGAVLQRAKPVKILFHHQKRDTAEDAMTDVATYANEVSSTLKVHNRENKQHLFNNGRLVMVITHMVKGDAQVSTPAPLSVRSRPARSPRFQTLYGDARRRRRHHDRAHPAPVRRVRRGHTHCARRVARRVRHACGVCAGAQDDRVHRVDRGGLRDAGGVRPGVRFHGHRMRARHRGTLDHGRPDIVYPVDF